MEEILAEIRDVKVRLAQIELGLARQEGARLQARMDLIEERARALEAWRAWLTGGLALAGSGLVAIAARMMVAP